MELDNFFPPHGAPPHREPPPPNFFLVTSLNKYCIQINVFKEELGQKGIKKLHVQFLAFLGRALKKSSQGTLKFLKIFRMS